MQSRLKNKMNHINLNKRALLITIFIQVFLIIPPIKAAEKITFVNGIFNRTISLSLLEQLAETGKAEGSLKNLIRLSNQSPEKISILLNQEIELPLVVTSKLMNSTIGEVIILRIAKIIYPFKRNDKSISVPAIRSAVIDGIYKNDGKLNMIRFLKSYPNKIMAINIPALLKVINKAETMSELIEFFSSSPLDKIKEGQN